MTELALIPPLSLLMESVVQRGTYLFLPQFLKYSNYAWYIQQAKKKESKLTILDNGAFEGVSCTITQLMQMAQKHDIDEVVLPDVLGNKTLTLEALKQVATVLPRTDWGKRQFMFVVQGQTFKECCDCIRIASAHVFPFKTFALPKHLLRTVAKTGDNDPKTIRLRLAHYIKKLYGDRYDIHFLGGSPVWIGEAHHLRDAGVRSMDTSMPFVYTAGGYPLKQAALVEHDLERQKNYFDLPYEAFDEELLARNITYLMRMVHG